MAQAIEQLQSGLTIGHAQLGQHQGQQGTVDTQVHDGDTVEVVLPGNLGVRFLGVDAPEVSFTLPGSKHFTPIGDPAWEQLLSDPFAPDLPAFDPPLDPGLRAFLHDRVGLGVAGNHARLGQAAKDELRRQVTADLAALGQTPAQFRVFCSFAHEVMDGFGRLLCFANRQQPSATDPAPRPLSYNERLLQAGLVVPYFIWPNVNPFRRQPALPDAVPEPGTAAQLAERDPALRAARRFVRDAAPTTPACTPRQTRCGCCRSSCASWPAATPQTGGWSTCPATRRRCCRRRRTSASPTPRTGCSSPPSTCRCSPSGAGNDHEPAAPPQARHDQRPLLRAGQHQLPLPTPGRTNDSSQPGPEASTSHARDHGDATAEQAADERPRSSSLHGGRGRWTPLPVRDPVRRLASSRWLAACLALAAVMAVSGCRGSSPSSAGSQPARTPAAPAPPSNGKAVAAWFQVHGPVAAKVFEDYSGAIGGPDPSKLVVASQNACQDVADDLRPCLPCHRSQTRPSSASRGVATQMRQAARTAASTGSSTAAKALYHANAQLGTPTTT
jgi:hypothetical protein